MTSISFSTEASARGCTPSDQKDQQDNALDHFIKLLVEQEREPNARVMSLFDELQTVPASTCSAVLVDLMSRIYAVCESVYPQPNSIMLGKLELYYEKRLSHIVSAIHKNKPSLEPGTWKDQNILRVVWAHGSETECIKIIERHYNEIDRMTYQKFCDTYLSFNLRSLLERHDGVEVVSKIFGWLKSKGASLAEGILNSPGLHFTHSPKLLELVLDEVPPEKRASYFTDGDLCFHTIKNCMDKSKTPNVVEVEAWIEFFRENGTNIDEVMLLTDHSDYTLIDYAALESTEEILQVLIKNTDKEALIQILEHHIELEGNTLANIGCYYFGDNRGCFEVMQKAMKELNVIKEDWTAPHSPFKKLTLTESSSPC